MATKDTTYLLRNVVTVVHVVVRRDFVTVVVSESIVVHVVV
jgi:hypothetical protein